MKKLFTLCLVAALSVAAARANNLVIAYNGSATVGSPATAYDLRTTVSWDNSWRDGENWDAAWLFVKYRLPGGVWRTATLATADASHSVPVGAALNAATDGKGVFVYRSVLGSGRFSAQTVLRWNAAADGIAANTSGIEIKVFGVEMVHVPQGAFNISSAVQPNTSNEFVSISGSLSQITSEAALPAGAIRWVNDTGAGGTGNSISVSGTTYMGSTALGANYPKGYAAMYCMKYEISQGQYTDFLNSLTRAQQNRRVTSNISTDSPDGGNVYVMAGTSSAATAFRNTITSPASGMGTTQPVTFSCSRPNRAANFLIWADGSAYLDWAGLRPMTELEYEKACRGPLPVVPGEFAWGSTSIGRAASFSGAEDGTETTDATANMAYNVSGGTPYVPFVGGDGGDGPVRSGIFARANTTREQAGASYYGIMELSGNCWERCITVAGFDGTFATGAGQFDLNNNGDGELDANGEQNVPTWPTGSSALGSNYRGGNWSRQRDWAAVADRTYGGFGDPSRTSHRSIRGVRSASTVNPATSNPSIPPINAAARYYGGSYDGYASAAGTLVASTRPGCAACAGVTATVVPNPVADASILQLSGRPALTDATLTLTDALGRVVRRQEHLRGLELEVNRNGLAPGVYTYQITENGEQVVFPGKLVVQ